MSLVVTALYLGAVAMAIRGGPLRLTGPGRRGIRHHHGGSGGGWYGDGDLFGDPYGDPRADILPYDGLPEADLPPADSWEPLPRGPRGLRRYVERGLVEIDAYLSVPSDLLPEHPDQDE